MKPKIALSDNIISKMTPAQRKEFGVSTTKERKAKRDIKVEKELQKLVEDWLHISGYWRRSPADIRTERPPKGWMVHLHQTRGNPILLDVLLLSNSGRFLEFELKTPRGKWSSPEQQLLCEHRDNPVFHDLDSVIKYVTEWENDN